MGGAMLDYWVRPDFCENFDAEFVVFDPGLDDGRLQRLEHYQAVQIWREESQFIEAFQNDDRAFDLVILAVKPQILVQLSALITSILSPNTILLSIAAGVSIERLQGIFGHIDGLSGDVIPVIRTMPNTPCAIGAGAVIGCATDMVSTQGRVLAEQLLRPLGYFNWVEDEKLLDSVTALSGSGPAYVFLFLEALSEAGEKLGLSAGLARDLALQTLLGSAKLAQNSKDFTQLRQNVTSPGGTTEKALGVLMAQDHLKSLIEDAMNAACNRARELNKM